MNHENNIFDLPPNRFWRMIVAVTILIFMALSIRLQEDVPIWIVRPILMATSCAWCAYLIAMAIRSVTQRVSQTSSSLRLAGEAVALFIASVVILNLNYFVLLPQYTQAISMHKSWAVITLIGMIEADLSKVKKEYERHAGLIWAPELPGHAIVGSSQPTYGTTFRLERRIQNKSLNKADDTDSTELTISYKLEEWESNTDYISGGGVPNTRLISVPAERTFTILVE